MIVRCCKQFVEQGTKQKDRNRVLQIMLQYYFCKLMFIEKAKQVLLLRLQSVLSAASLSHTYYICIYNKIAVSLIDTVLKVE